MNRRLTAGLRTLGLRATGSRRIALRPQANVPQAAPARHVYSEFVGNDGVDATRYGDWEYSGRCTDF